ncbi:hypothetical protein EDC96DRAFT_545906 [Choanephora cucurbitarum]|nr:hypothetical protein EDC96DRAFT_545906 [Choanephora cucurbitarum]
MSIRPLKSTDSWMRFNQDYIYVKYDKATNSRDTLHLFTIGLSGLSCMVFNQLIPTFSPKETSRFKAKELKIKVHLARRELSDLFSANLHAGPNHQIQMGDEFKGREGREGGGGKSVEEIQRSGGRLR